MTAKRALTDKAPVAHVRQRIKRTAVQTTLGYVAAAITVLPIVLDAILQLKAYLPDALVVGLVSALAVSVAVSAALAKLMSIPAVDAWLTAKVNLGQVPRVSLPSQEETDTPASDDPAIEEPEDTGEDTNEDANVG